MPSRFVQSGRVGASVLVLACALAAGLVAACAAFDSANGDPAEPAPGADAAGGSDGEGATPPPALDDGGRWVDGVRLAAPAADLCDASALYWPPVAPAALQGPSYDNAVPPATPPTIFRCTASANTATKCGVEWAARTGAGATSFALAVRVPVLVEDPSDGSGQDIVQIEDDAKVSVQMTADRRLALEANGQRLAVEGAFPTGALLVLRVAFDARGGFADLRVGCDGVPVALPLPAGYFAPETEVDVELGLRRATKGTAIELTELRFVREAQ